MNIYILEDNAYFRRWFLQALHQLKKQFLLNIENITMSVSPQELLKKLRKFEKQDLIILDIEIGQDKRAGLKTAAKIREKRPDVNLLFLTAYPDLIAESFNYRTFALDFIDKTLSQNELNKRLISNIQFISTQNQHDSEPLFYFKNKHAEFRVPKNEIFYFETSTTKHKIILNAKTKVLEFTSTLNEIENKDSEFIRTNKAYVANLSTVSGINKQQKKVLFAEDTSCPVSRKYYKKLIYLFEEKSS